MCLLFNSCEEKNLFFVVLVNGKLSINCLHYDTNRNVHKRRLNVNANLTKPFKIG